MTMTKVFTPQVYSVYTYHGWCGTVRCWKRFLSNYFRFLLNTLLFKR